MALANGLVQVNIRSHEADLQQTSNTFHIFNPSAGAPPDVTELTTLATQLASQLTTVYRAMLVTTATLDDIVCKSVNLPGGSDIPGEATSTINQAGTRTIAGTAMPKALCALVALRVPAATRRFRGHMFMPPAFNSGSVAGNNLDTSNAYYTAVVAYAAELAKGTPTGAGWTGSSLSHYQLVVYSPTQAAAALPYTGLVQAVVVRLHVSFLRSRERGGT